jgi:hypothetical protein
MPKRLFSTQNIFLLSVIFCCCLIVQETVAQNDFSKKRTLPPVFPVLGKSIHSTAPARSVASQKLFQRDIHLDTAAFTLYPASLTGVMAGDAVWIDFDGDGDLDLIVTGWDDTEFVTKIYRNDNGTFTDIHANIIGIGTEKGVSWGDYDNDGDYDLLISGGLNQDQSEPVTKIYRNDNGTFVDIGAPLMQLEGGSATWIDYNCDGKLDLLVTGSPDGGSSFYSKLYRNDDSTFTDSNIWLPGVWGSSVAWGDYDNDGYPDLLISGYGGDAITALFHNDSGSSFTQVPVPFQPVNACGVAWGDYDNDGLLDIIVSGDPPGWGSNNFTTIYRNLGNGQFQDIHPNLPQLNLTAVAWGDYDNDGDLDVAISGWQNDSTNVTKIFRNDGNGVFTDIHADLPPVWWGSLAWGDVDNDGKLDLLMTGATTPHIYASHDPPYYPVTLIFHNNTPTPGTKPGLPGNPTVSVSGGTANFSWDKAIDSKTPSIALTYNIRVGTSPGSGDIVSPSSNLTGYRRIPQHGNRYVTSTYAIDHLPVGTYYWSVQSVNNAFMGSSFAPEGSFAVIPQSSWHLVSVPYNYPDTHKNVLFPTAKSPAFAYLISGGYVTEDILNIGTGYWVSFPGITLPLFPSGNTLSSTTIPVHEGWNLIGSIDHSVSVPASPLIISNFFGYDQGYQIVSTIEPGKGYWVKVNAEGSLTLGGPATRTKAGSDGFWGYNTMTVTDANKNKQTLYFGESPVAQLFPEKYELPPVGPEGVFDVRFATNQMVATCGAGKSAATPINISSASYPVTICWNLVHPVTATLVINGKTIDLRTNGTVQVSAPDSRVTLMMEPVKTVPGVYALEQNYPNPFNPTTIIRYSLPNADHVTLQVINLLGQVTRTLVDEVQSAGYKEISFDAKDLPSGIYFYRLLAGKFTDTKKTILLK